MIASFRRDTALQVPQWRKYKKVGSGCTKVIDFQHTVADHRGKAYVTTIEMKVFVEHNSSTILLGELNK